MHGIYQLRDRLCEELDEYGKKGEINTQMLSVVDMMAHTVKNLDKIIESDEEDGGYSERGRVYRSYDDGRNGYDPYDTSYRRGRGRNARRDSMGRYMGDGRYMSDGRSMRRGYSRDDGREEMISDLEDLMQKSTDDMMRQRIEQLIGQIRNG